jgi:small-conductance mechanosensitive channel
MGTRYSHHRTQDHLIAAFIGRIVWTAVFIVGTVIALGILGLGNVSNKILAGAGITTFVIGFALKDIGENFLAGVILAFSRPYREGSLIECDGIKGIVKSMTMRQTTVEAENGRLILIPNSSIIKQPLTKYDDSDLDMRQEFSLSVDPADARAAIKIIDQSISGVKFVHHHEKKAVKVIVDSLRSDKATLNVIFWFDTTRFEGSRSETKSEIILQVLDDLKSANIKYSGV